MNIYTKTGDTGTTSLIGGTRVAKNNPRVEAYGNVDELNTHIGIVRTYISNDCLPEIQKTLISISAHLANDGSCKTLSPITQESVLLLERSIDQMQGQLPPIKSFVIPGPPAAAAFCQIARAVCRRAERSVVALGTESTPGQITAYLNRLSDFLFILSRYITIQQKCDELFF